MASNECDDRLAEERPLSKTALADYFGVSVRQVERLMAAGLIEFFRIGRSPRFSRAAIASFEHRNGFDGPTLSPDRCRSRGASRRFPFMQEPDRGFERLLGSTEERS